MTAVTISFEKPDGSTLAIEQTTGQDHRPRYAIRRTQPDDDPYIEGEPDVADGALVLQEVSNLDADDARSLRDALIMLFGPDIRYVSGV